MTEILTESFCERCGTRYTFESAAPRRSRLGKVRTLSKGMKNFVLSDDASFSEAMAEARSEEEFTAVSHQLDAFHQTFNFCLTCRQYTCGDCWNTAEGRCLTCAPIPGMEEPVIAAAMLVDLLPPPFETLGADTADDTWPDEDLSAARLSRALGLDEAESEATVEAVAQEAEFDLDAATAAAAAVAGTAGVAAIADANDEVAGVADVEPLAFAESPGAALEEAAPSVIGVAPGQSLEDAVAEYEARIAAEETETVLAEAPVEVTPEAEPVVAEAVVAEAVVAEAEPVVAEAVETPSSDEAVVDEDLPLAATAAAETAAQPEAEPAADAEPEPEPVAPAIAAATVVAAVADEPSAAEPDHGLAAAALAGFAAGAVAPDRDEAPVEPLAAAAAAPPAPEPEPVAPEAEPVAAEPARVDVVPQPTWPQPSPSRDGGEPVPAVPDQPGSAPAPWLTVAPEDSESPQWPVAPAFPTPPVRRDMPTTLAGRPIVPQADPSGLWAASAREVLTGAAQAPIPVAAAVAPTAQPCVSCGLSLSANARFCRRCGTRQG